MGFRVYVDGLVHGVAPPVDPDPVHHEEKGVHEQGGESQVPRDGMVEDGSLKGHPESGPYLAVSSDRDEDDGEVGGAHEPHDDRSDLQPVHRITRNINECRVCPAR